MTGSKWRAWFGDYAIDDPIEVGDLDEFLQGILAACGYDSGDALESYNPLLEHVVGLVANTITDLRAHMTPEQRAAFDDDYMRKFPPVRPREEATTDLCPHCGRGICVGCPLGEATDAPQ